MLLRPGCRRWRHCRRPVECVSSLPSRRSVEWHFGKDVPQGLKRLRKKSAPDRKAKPQGLKPDVFSIIYGPTKVVP